MALGSLSSMLIPAIIVVASLITGFGARYWLKSDPSAEVVVEKMAEEALKEETGIDINFEQPSPNKPSEPKK